MPDETTPPDALEVAKRLAAALEKRGCEFAVGGAIALGFWAAPRGTVDVDLTLFVPPDRPSECVWLLQEIGCELDAGEATRSLHEHGFCRVTCDGLRVDIFLPIVPFYEIARQRRKMISIDDKQIPIWDAATLCVFKMMFFRRKDIADVEQILRGQSANFDAQWVHDQLETLYGNRDPRLAQWDELVRDTA